MDWLKTELVGWNSTGKPDWSHLWLNLDWARRKFVSPAKLWRQVLQSSSGDLCPVI